MRTLGALLAEQRSPLEVLLFIGLTPIPFRVAAFIELLVAADIIRTVALEQTLTNVAILAILVLVRTFLSWSLTVEIEGRWPWTGREVAPEQT